MQTKEKKIAELRADIGATHVEELRRELFNATLPQPENKLLEQLIREASKPAKTKKGLTFDLQDESSKKIRALLSKQLGLKKNKFVDKSFSLSAGTRNDIVNTVVFSMVNNQSDFLGDFNQQELTTKTTKALVGLNPTANMAAFTANPRPFIDKTMKEVVLTKNQLGFRTNLSLETWEDAVDTQPNVKQLLEDYAAGDVRATIENACFNATVGVHGFDGLVAQAANYTSTHKADHTVINSVNVLLAAAAANIDPAAQGSLTAYISETEYLQMLSETTDSELKVVEKAFKKIVVVPYLTGNTFAVVVNADSFVLGQSKTLGERHKLDVETEIIESSYVTYVDFQPIEGDKVHAVNINFAA